METVPLKKLSSLAEDIHIKIRETSRNTNLDIWKFLGINKALQTIQSELANNNSNLTEIDKSIKKIKEVEGDPLFWRTEAAI